MFGRKKCIHQWTKQSEMIAPSLMEQMASAGVTKLSGEVISGPIGDKKMLVVLTCDKCGQVREIRH